MSAVIDQLRGGLIVSCQAPHISPLRNSDAIAIMARCAELGGAVALRINGVDDIKASLERVALPIIGLNKTRGAIGRDIITPGFEFAQPLAQAGAHVIALEATDEVPGDPLRLIRRINDELLRPVMADVATLDQGLAAWDAGAALVGSTMSGYTAATRSVGPGPDLGLVEALASRSVRTIAEGRYWTADEVASAFDAGAWAVVVGTVITNPIAITQRFVGATPSSLER